MQEKGGAALDCILVLFIESQLCFCGLKKLENFVS